MSKYNNTLNNGKYVFQRKPRICRQCHGNSIATYLYGEPNEKAVLMFETGKYAPAGCSFEMNEYQRAWCCNDCGFEFYKKADGL
ncbi:hypothetical protein [Colwellia sp. RSH04]|uniref:hypothetical protein n=1 Tax=Colwellia sp. RSH04 TaxID=2305464 RepID=UPI000E587BBC|nr:hypothetical protein [Colwellia sp. RSH04]RHW75049.1 hypothetical protein D1094_15605 [Colwellia sp. RSH04]